MSDNHHHRAAQYTSFEASERQIEATLSLAYEQRTANLLAFERDQWQAWKEGTLNEEGQRLWEKAAKQIPARLGLE